MTDTAHQRAGLAAVITGVVLGATSAAGIALLLYTGQGFLKAAGLLVSATLMAMAAGVWAAGTEPAPMRGRWITLTISFLAAGAFTGYWGAHEGLRALALGGALAVLLVLALPAYAAGLALAGLHTRSRAGGVAAAAAAGAALGTLLATTILIQLLEPYGIYYASALLVSLTSILARDAALPPRHGEPDMRDHVTLITGVGGPDQLGYTIAQRFARAGARVIISARGTNLQEVAAALARHGDVAAVHADLSRDDDVRTLLDEVTRRCGRLDSLINTAGGLTHVGSVEGTTLEQWRGELERNAETVLRLSRAALPLLRASRGVIVNFAAPAGERAAAGLAAYSAAKAAVLALTRALALEENEHGVRVNAIAPGMLDSPGNRASAGDGAAFVARDDVAAVAFFLATPAARSITGETVHVAGDTLR